jgi:thiosulfate reductase cytochrome b subunit
LNTKATTEAQLFYRHRLPVRIMHWTNALSFVVMLMTGLAIFNAHPSLYWGQASHFDTPLLTIDAVMGPNGEPRGRTHIGKYKFDTDGVLGASRVLDDDVYSSRAFPGWATIPSRQSLALARNWHFFFSWIFVLNGLAYIAYAIGSGHLRRDMLPTRAELKSIGSSILQHLRFKHPTGEAAKRYNVLQNLAYLVVVFGLLPLIVVAGLALSPRLDALFDGGWVELLGGRQSARTLHFLAAFGLLAFLLIHLFEVVVTGLWNNLRSMITGTYRVPPDPAPQPPKAKPAKENTP